MPYFVPGDPNARKTPAELDAEETPREKLDDVNNRHQPFVWGVAILAALAIAGGVIRACLS